MKRKQIVCLVFSALLFTGCAVKQPVSPIPDQIDQHIVQHSELGDKLKYFINNQGHTNFFIELLPRYGGEYLRIGDIFDIDLRSSQAAYLHLYLFQTSGIVVALTENLYVPAGQKMAFPPVDSNYQLRAHPPTGQNTLLLLATKAPIQGTIYHDGRYLAVPHNIISTQFGAIASIKNQLRHFSENEWRSTIRDIPVYQ